jgi:hypothetical protein
LQQILMILKKNSINHFSTEINENSHS